MAFYNRTYLCTIHKCPSYLLSYHITNAVYDVTLYISIFNTIFFLRFPQLLWSPPPPCLHRPPSPLPRSLSHLPRTKQFQNTLRKTCKQDQTSSGICCYQFNQNLPLPPPQTSPPPIRPPTLNIRLYLKRTCIYSFATLITCCGINVMSSNSQCVIMDINVNTVNY